MFYLRVLLPAAFVLAAVVLLWCPITATDSSETTGRARKFIDDHTARLRPLEVAGALAWWRVRHSSLRTSPAGGRLREAYEHHSSRRRS